MSLTTEEIIGGMYRAHRAGQPFAALVANPQFANLPLEQKKEVLAGLRQRMGGETSSTANALTAMIKGTAGGALSGIPLGVAVPLALEMSESGATKRSVLEALKFAASNKNVKMLVGSGIALGATAGLLNSAFSLHQANKDKETFKKDLEDASHGGEALAAASFGAIGGSSAPRHINVSPVIKTFGDVATPSLMASARFGHLAALADSAKHPDEYAQMIMNLNNKAVSGTPLDPDKIRDILGKLEKNRDVYQSLQSTVVNSPRELHIDLGSAQAIQADLVDQQNQTNENIANLSLIEQYARQLRDMKRGAN